MGHYIQCIIGKEEVICELEKNWIHAYQLKLTNGFSLIPLTDELIDDMNELANKGIEIAYEEFEILSKSVEIVIKESSYINKIAYIETEYSGGNGVQSAISFYRGKVYEGPKLTKTVWNETLQEFVIEPKEERAINSILLGLGLEKRDDKDAFDNLGLGNFRTNEKIIKAYNTKLNL